MNGKEMWKIALRADYAPSVDVRIIKSNDQTDPIAKLLQRLLNIL